jgi:hypothetical protein
LTVETKVKPDSRKITNILGITLEAVIAFSDPWQALGPI